MLRACPIVGKEEMKDTSYPGHWGCPQTYNPRSGWFRRFIESI
jgi:hypothetical protein